MTQFVGAYENIINALTYSIELSCSDHDFYLIYMKNYDIITLGFLKNNL